MILSLYTCTRNKRIVTLTLYLYIDNCNVKQWGIKKRFSKTPIKPSFPLLFFGSSYNIMNSIVVEIKLNDCGT